jgi:hypothetical protein
VQQTTPNAFVVTVIKEPVKEMTVADLIVGSLGIAGSLLLLAVVLGAVAGGALVVWNRLFPATRRHLPPVRPSFTDAGLPPTSQPQ